MASFGDKGQQWYDWCLVNWTENDEERTYPAKILGFVNMDPTGIKSEYCLVWATLKTIASSDILDL